MSKLDEIVLSANGIVRSCDNELRCFLCTIDENSRDWQSHIENSQHVGALKQFRLIFVLNDEKINCKACNSLIDWEGLKNHAKWHKIVPWYEIEEKHKIFFENRIMNVNSTFDCLPCKVKFAEWSRAFVHISEDGHQKSLSLQPPLHESFTPVGTSYELLITEGFEPWGATSVKCKLCNCPNVYLKTLSQHVESADHKNAKKKFSSGFEIHRDTQGETNTKVSSKPVANLGRDHDRRSQTPTASGRYNRANGQPLRHRTASIDRFSSRNSLCDNMKTIGPKLRQDSTNFPVEKRASGRYCTICEIAVHTTVDVHLSDEKHLAMLRQYGHEYIEQVDECKFRCKCCDCQVPNLENVYRHIKGYNHRNRLKNKTGTVTEKKEDSQKGKTISFKMNFPQQTKTTLPQKTGTSNVLAPGMHDPRLIAPSFAPTVGTGYAQSIRTGPPNPLAPAFIPALVPPAFPHRIGTIHPHQVAMNFQHQILPSLPQESTEKLTSSAWEALPRDYIVIQNSNDLFCRICDCAIYGHNNVDDHINGNNHKDAVKEFCATIFQRGGNVYYCKKCNLEINGRDNLYMHLSGPVHTVGTKNAIISKNHAIDDNSMKREFANKLNITDEKTSKPENHSSGSVSSHDCIVVLGKADFCCKICHQVLRDSAKIPEHLQSEAHEKSVSLYGRAGYKGNEYEGKYYCKFCSCTIPNFANVPLHTIGLKHKNSFPVPAKIFSPPRPKVIELASSFIGLIDEDTYYCRICNVSLFGETELNNHKVDKMHDDAMEKYGCNAICVMKNNQYDCPYCECDIPDFDNIYVHVSGKRHLQNMQNARRNGDKKRDNFPEKAKVPGTIDSHDSDAKYRENSSNENTNETPMKQNFSNDTAKKITHHDDREEVISQSYIANARKPEDSSVAKKMKNESEIVRNMNSKEKSTDPQDWERMIDMILIDAMPKSEKQRIATTTTSSEENRKIKSTGMVPESSIPFERAKMNKDNKSSLQGNRDRDFFDSKIDSDDNEYASLKRSNETLATLDGDALKIRSLASSTLSLNSNGITGRKRRTPKAAVSINEKKIFNIDHIYEMKDKLTELERAMKFCVIKESNDIYCLICRKKIADTPQNCAEHFWSLEHCEFFESMEKDHALFEVVSGQYSELDLAAHYLEETSEDLIYCHVCDTDIDNIDFTLKDHMAEEFHKKKFQAMREKTQASFHDVKSTIRCDWYKIYKYWCVFCSANFDSELSFAKHLKSSGHSSVVKKMENNYKGMMYDYCSSCTLLWYGYRSTYANHVEIPSHKWLLKDDDQVSPKLPTSVKCLLNMPSEYIQDSIKYLDEVSAKNSDKEEALIRDLEKTARLYFVDAEANPFGSKVAGLESGENGIEIFLDCKDKRDVDGASKDRIAYLRTKIKECLNQDQNLWHTEEILMKSSVGSITALHRPTGISCDIYFDNEISVTTTKLIKALNEKFPVCREIIIFLKPWLEFCDLFGPEKITIDALSWLVIFYLQRESLLPKIATCIEPAKKSNLTAGWAINVNRLSSVEESNRNIKRLLSEFFQFYANFDYRYDVACPLIAETLKKQIFASPRNLPAEMKPYVDYLTNSRDPEAFRIELPMCLQNPLSLVDNLTKSVSKVQMSRFRTYCFKSLDILDGVLS